MKLWAGLNSWAGVDLWAGVDSWAGASSRAGAGAGSGTEVLMVKSVEGLNAGLRWAGAPNFVGDGTGWSRQKATNHQEIGIEIIHHPVPSKSMHWTSKCSRSPDGPVPGIPQNIPKLKH